MSCSATSGVRMFSRLSNLLLVLALLWANALASAAEAITVPRPLPRPFAMLVLPEVKFRDADLAGAILYLQRKADVSSAGKFRVPFVLDLPESFEPRYELTLNLQAIPFAEALRYVGEQAGVEFSPENGVVMVRLLGTASAAQAAADAKRKGSGDPPPNRPPAAGGLTGALSKMPKPATGMRNVHRATNGEIQPEKSGYIRNRTLSGWEVPKDPTNHTGVNCITPAKCPKGACGCKICACRERQPVATPRP